MMQWGWRHRAEWSPLLDWSFNGAVFVNGELVGVQSLMAKDFTFSSLSEKLDLG